MIRKARTACDMYTKQCQKAIAGRLPVQDGLYNFGMENGILLKLYCVSFVPFVLLLRIWGVEGLFNPRPSCRRRHPATLAELKKGRQGWRRCANCDCQFQCSSDQLNNNILHHHPESRPSNSSSLLFLLLLRRLCPSFILRCSQISPNSLFYNGTAGALLLLPPRLACRDSHSFPYCTPSLVAFAQSKLFQQLQLSLPCKLSLPATNIIPCATLLARFVLDILHFYKPLPGFFVSVIFLCSLQLLINTIASPS